MSASVMDAIATPDKTPASSTSVIDTTKHFSLPTVWTTSLNGYVESGCPQITDAELTALNPLMKQRLKQLAIDRGEQVEDTIRAISNFFYEQESNLLYEPLGIAVAWYMDNIFVG